MTETKTEKQTDLTEAFSKFQEHCQKLEDVQKKLRQQLEEAHLELEDKNKELSKRLDEIEFMRKRLSTVLESITDVAMLIDKDGKIDLANQAAKNFFGTELAGRLFRDEAPEIAGHLNTEQGDYDRELILSFGDDTRVVIASAIPTSKDQQAYDSCVIAVKDITEYRELQKKVARKERLAALGKVAASVAHEIRNPLGAVEGFAQLLQKDLEGQNEKTSRLAGKIVQGTRELNDVVTNLLEYTRNPQYNFQKNKLNLIMQDVISMIQPKAKQNGVTIEYTISPEDLKCRIDAVQIKQVLSNLIENAVDACPLQDSGKVSISASTDNKNVNLNICDNGNGIPDGEKRKIFEPFFTTKEDGIGLGLPMCKRIIEGHNGTIEAADNAGCGTRMNITLPIGDIGND